MILIFTPIRGSADIIIGSVGAPCLPAGRDLSSPSGYFSRVGYLPVGRQESDPYKDFFNGLNLSPSSYLPPFLNYDIDFYYHYIFKKI